MVRYLSPGWFARLHELGASAPASRAGSLVLRHEVTDGPDGDVTYDVVVATGTASIDASAGPADVTFRTDYPTAAAIASGRGSVHAALAEGRLRVSGNMAALTDRAAELAGHDPVPAALRDETGF